MDDQNFNDEVANEWINTIEAESARIRDQDIYPILNSWIEDIKPNHILDIGCGQGVCSAELDLKNRKYVGVDPSPALIQRAKNLYSATQREFILGNAYALPFSDNSFQAIFSIALWHLLGDLPSAAQEMARVLSPSGSFLIISADPEAYSHWTKPYDEKKFDGKKFTGINHTAGHKPVTDVLYLHTKEEIFKAIESAGFEILQTQRFRNQIALNGRKIL